MIALAIENADRYVGGAYLVFLLLLLIYVAIMAAKLGRIQRELGSLAELSDRPDSPDRPQARTPEHDLGQVRGREQEIEAVRQGDRG